MNNGPSGIIFKILIFVILAVALYNLYNWLYGTSAGFADRVIYQSANSGLPGKSDTAVTYNSSVVPPLIEGSEYSVSTWIYITNWGINSGKNKVFLTLSGGGTGTAGYNTLAMYLGQNVNKLGIRVSQNTPGQSSSAFLLNSQQMALLTTGTTPYSDTDADFKMCDIEKVDIQKWVNITAVLSGSNLDIYIDGKLSRSCVLGGLFKVDSGSPTMVLGGLNGFGGLIGKTRAANFAYSPDQVYKNYQDGPFNSSMFAGLSFSNLFNWGGSCPNMPSFPVNVNDTTIRL